MPDRPILHGETVLLRPVRAEDAEALYASLADEEVNRLTGTLQSFTFEQVEAHYAGVGEADDRADYLILPKDGDDKALGEVVLNDIDWHNRTANFRIALFDRVYFGKGYGSQATRLMLAYGFETLGLHRIELEVFAFNPRAIRVYEKVGFKKEGVKREVLLWDGVYYDAIVMGILESEFHELNAT